MAATLETMAAEARPVEFFYRHAGYSYKPGEETQDQGRMRCARALAHAEAEASRRGWSVRWDRDGLTNREWTDEGEEYGTWQAVMVDGDGKALQSVCGVDFGADGEPWSDPYRRVVEAELATEALEEAGE